MKIYLSALSTESRDSTGKAAKKFLDYIKEKNIPFVDAGDEYDATVAIECKDEKFAEFLKKLGDKFGCPCIVTMKNQMILKNIDADVEV